jgi:hypothetical protein
MPDAARVKCANGASPTIEGVATTLANTFGSSEPREQARFGRLLAPLRYWHLASLDAPTVAVVWGWAFAWVGHVRLAIWPLVLLGLVVWVVYVGDRLLDARAGLRNPPRHDLRERHHFHWQHRRVLGPVAAVAGVAAAWIVRSRVPAIALPQDSAVAVAALAYFSGVHSGLRLPPPVGRVLAVFGAVFGCRECLVGALFAAGCALPAWTMYAAGDPVWNSPASPARQLALPAMYFAGLAWLNVRAITDWESGELRQNRLPIGRIALGLGAGGVALAAWLVPAQPRAAGLMAAGAASALLIGWLDWRREDFNLLTLRVAVDLVLLTPLLLVAAQVGR